MFLLFFSKRRPLVGVAIVYVVGTWLGLTRSVDSRVLWQGALVLAVGGLGLGLLRRNAAAGRLHPVSLSIHAAILLTAWALAMTSASQALGRRFASIRGTTFVTGMIAGDPDGWQGRYGGRVWNFPLRVETLRGGAGRDEPVAGRMKVRWYAGSRRARPRYGDRVLLQGRSEAGNSAVGSVIPGRRRFKVKRGGLEYLSFGHGSWFPRFCYEARRKAAARLRLGIEDRPRTVAMLHALLLGYRGGLPRAILDMSAASGTLHIFAISGLHVGVVAGMILFILRSFRVSRPYWILLMGPLLIAYTVGTGMRPSAMRACLMAMVYWTAPLLRRRADGLSAVAFSALIILGLAPDQLFDLGFIFSFAVETGIVILYPLFSARLLPIVEPDAFRVQPEAQPVAMARRFAKYWLSILCVTLAAWLTSAPLAAYFFGRFTPLSLITNLLVVPLTFLSVLAGCLSIILGSCLDIFADIFNHANLALLSVLEAAMGSVALLAFPVMAPGTISAWCVAAWYGALGLLALWLKVKTVDTRVG
ncbi:MAG: ComEC/Rec2 family competence protein [Lentisphaerae bacterium]|nr:ComEC/Rec2 family competence protein [Lentisphaerota bacterium]